MADKRVSELSDHLGFWLRAVSNHVSYSFARNLAAMEVTVAEWVVLRTLYDRPPTAPSQIAKELGMTRGAITKLASRLIDQGLVLRKSNPDDGRAQTLELTRQGTELVPRLASLADENDAETFGHLTEAERETLSLLLHRLVEHSNLKEIPIT